MLFAKLKPQCLRSIQGQTVILCVARIKADDVVMAFDVSTREIFIVRQIRFHASDCKIFLAAQDRINAVILAWDQMPILIQDRLVGDLVVLEY